MHIAEKILLMPFTLARLPLICVTTLADRAPIWAYLAFTSHNHPRLKMDFATSEGTEDING